MILRNLAALAYGHGFTLWHYRDPTGTLMDLLKPGFFNKAGPLGESNILARGDLIIANYSRGCTLLWVSDLSAAGVMVEPLVGGLPSPFIPQSFPDDEENTPYPPEGRKDSPHV